MCRANERFSLHTCAQDSSKDPALAVFDWLVSALEPLLQDGHTATPVQWAGATAIFALPLALYHTTVIVAVHLSREGLSQSLGCHAHFHCKIIFKLRDPKSNESLLAFKLSENENTLLS